MTSSNSGDWNPDQMLRLYMHDYMIKRGMHGAAEIFKNEAQLPNNVDLLYESPEGFLHEWWSVFYAVFTSRQRKDQEIGPESSTKDPMIVDNARNSIPPRSRTLQTPMSEQRLQQFYTQRQRQR